jgi:hypothetical protein
MYNGYIYSKDDVRTPFVKLLASSPQFLIPYYPILYQILRHVYYSATFRIKHELHKEEEVNVVSIYLSLCTPRQPPPFFSQCVEK